MKRFFFGLWALSALVSPAVHAFESCTCTYTSVYTPDDRTLYVCILSGLNADRGRFQEIARENVKTPQSCDGSRKGCASVFTNDAGKCTTWRH